MENQEKQQGSLKNILIFLFGSLKLQYEPPLFIKKARGAINSFGTKNWRRFNNFRKKRKKLFFSILALIILIPIGFTAFNMYKNSLPEPIRVRFSGNSPSSVTPGSDSLPEKLVLSFNDSAVKLNLVGKIVVDGITLVPEKSGEWKWDDDRTLAFTPVDDWDVGQKYTVKVEKNLFPNHIELDKYDYSFETSAFSLSISNIQYYIDPLNPALKQIVSTIRFTHPVDTEAFEKSIALKTVKSEPDESWYKDRDFAFNVAYNDYFSEAYITSENLEIPENSVSIELVLKKGVFSSAGGKPTQSQSSRSLSIDGKAEFVKILSINTQNVRNDRYELEQVLIIESKGEADVNELMKYIEVYQLPENKPAVEGSDEIRNFRWTDPMLVGSLELEKSTSISLSSIPTEKNQSSLNSYRFKAEPGRYLYIRIKRGTPFFGGYELMKNIVSTDLVEDFPKELSILHDGALLSMSGEKKISLLSRGITNVKATVGRVLPDQINHLVSQTNGDITDLRFRGWNFNQDNLTEKESVDISLAGADPGEAEYFSFDFSRFLGTEGNGKLRNGIFFFNINEWNPRTNSLGRIKDSRFVILTDLGILVKQNTDGSRDLFVQSIATGLPVSGVKVQVLGKNGIDLLVKNTDVRGHVSIPSLAGFLREKSPTAYIVSKGSDLSFLPYEGSGRRLDYSGFDTGGVYGVSEPDRINAYLFSDRGIYRPGDSMNIAMIVKSGNWDRSLTNIPLEVSISDSRGLEVFRQRISLDRTGLEDVNFKTESYSPTGTYQVNLYSIKDNRSEDLIGSTTVRVEEFEPDRLKISTSLSQISHTGWISPEGLGGRVNLKNLFGNAAVGNSVDGKLVLTPAYISFRQYRDFRFFDPLRAENYYDEDLGSAKTDLDGNCEFDFDLNRFDSASYNLRFIAEAFEKEGGRSVVSEQSMLVSPVSSLVGVKSDGDLSYIYKNGKRSLNFIAVDSTLNQIERNDLFFHLNEMRWVSVLTKQPNGTYKYQSVKKEISLFSEDFNISANGSSYVLKTDVPGDFELIISDKEGMELNRINYSVLGSVNAVGNLDKNAELQVRLSKDDYAPGEEIELHIKAPYSGAGLISIERDKVYTYKWFKSSQNSSIQTITVPDDLEGNAYVNVSFIRSADSDQIYMSPLSYGAVPFSVSRERRTNNVQLEIDGEILPGEDLNIRYSTKNSGKIIVYAVDEGILQVARYKTPDPLSYFFQKMALEVSTLQILDLILPEFSLVRKLAAMGGGEAYGELNANLNPFKRKNKPPVVFWSGIVDCDSTERTLSYRIPDYFNGTVRVMAVAVSNDAIGVAQDSILIRDKYIISPNIPYFAAPGDRFDLSVTVTNNVAGADEKIQLTLDTSDGLSVEENSREMTIAEGRDQTVSFQVSVNDIPGAGEISFHAIGDSYESDLIESISIRPAMPYRTTLNSGYVDKGKVEIDVPRQMYEEYRILEGSLSYLPLGLAKGLTQYLDEYPYLCSEQVVSNSFASLILEGNEGFNLDRAAVTTDIEETIRILMSRQVRNGSFGVWAANDYISYFQNVYIMHFLTEARERGYRVPDSMYDKGLEFLKEIIGVNKKDIYTLRQKTYAIYILTRNEMITSSYISRVQAELKDNFDDWEKDVAGLYLASSYYMLQNKTEGMRLFGKFNPENQEVKEADNYYNREIRNAIYLYLRAEYFSNYEKKMPISLVESFSNSIQNGIYSTTFASYVIMGLNSYKDASGQPALNSVKIEESTTDERTVVLQPDVSYFPRFEYSSDAASITIENGDVNRLYYSVIQSGFDNSAPLESLAEKVEIFREYTDQDGEILDEVELGQLIDVHIKVRAIGVSVLRDIAIVDLLPGGFEPAMDSQNQGGWTPVYMDRREDRVVLFGDIDNDINEYIYQIRSVNKGSFTVPPAYIESMYDPSVMAVTPGGKITVTGE